MAPNIKSSVTSDTAKPALTQARLKELLHYDPETGVFLWVKQRGKNHAGSEAGSVFGNGYWYIGVDKKPYLSSRLAWLYVTGKWPDDEIRFLDEDKDNLSFSNLNSFIRVDDVQRRKARELTWRINNRTHRQASHAEYRKLNAEKIRRWRAENRDRLNALSHSYRARKAAAGGKLSRDIIKKLMRLQKGLCINCRANLVKSGHHLDHVQPLSKGGSNTDLNVQLLCPSCNCKKRSIDPIDWANRNGRLL